VKEDISLQRNLRIFLRIRANHAMLVFEWRRKFVAFIRAYDALVTKKSEDLCCLTPVFVLTEVWHVATYAFY
jgi:hypothetical protein